MSLKPFILLFLCLSLAHALHKPQTFKINLDLPPQERFKEVILAKQSEIRKFINIFFQMTPKEFFPILNLVDSIVPIHKEFYEELEGVAKYANCSLQKAFAINLIYEVLASCTSIVSVSSDGSIIHGRNLDYFFGPYISSFMVHFEFYRNGNLIYEGDGNAGFLGLVTGMKKDRFAISLNQRSSNNTSESASINFERVLPIPYFIRNVLDEAEDYQTAKKMLSDEPFGANAYIIISGIEKNEGTIITRDRNKVVNISNINEEIENEWFLVQTNYDRDQPDPEKDLRRLPAENRIKKIGKDQINLSDLFNSILSLSPNKNSRTISSTVMCAKSGIFNTTIWDDSQ